MGISKIELYRTLLALMTAAVLTPCAGQVSISQGQLSPEMLKPRIRLYSLGSRHVSQKDQAAINLLHQPCLPFFCHMESVIEKKSRIALRLRLGDLNYVNTLENKK